MNRTGTTHLIAISGMHVTLIAVIMFFIIDRLWRLTGLRRWHWPSSRVAAPAAALAALGYSALAGFSIPTQRAAVMVTVAVAGVFAQRGTRPDVLLALALIAVLVYDPFAVLSPGMWLSFAAVGLILYGMGGRLKAAGAWWTWGRVHWVVGLGLIPILLVLFHRASGISPLANFLAVPYVTFISTPLTLLGVALLPLWTGLGALLLQLADRSLVLFWWWLEWVGQAEQRPWLRHAPLAWTLAPALIGVLLALAPRGLPGRWLGAVWLLPLLLVRPVGPAGGELWFSVLDVGQGLATVARTAHHVLVFDTGPRFSADFEAGSAAVVPFLRHAGIDRIDTLIVSHGDQDHSGGAETVLREIEVNRLLTSAPERFPGAAPQTCAAGETWVWDEVYFEMLNPVSEKTPGTERRNDDSCVLRIRTVGGSVLLPGDIEKQAERRLAHDWGEHLQADVVVAPHHGSNTSSTADFVGAVRPRYAVFSVGYRNRFGFPKPNIVERYQAYGAVPLLTSHEGTLSFRISPSGGVQPPLGYRQEMRRLWHQ